MSWFDRNPEFSNRRIRKNTECQGTHVTAVAALNSATEEWRTSHLCNPLLGTPQSAAVRKEREASVTFSCALTNEEYGAQVVRKSAATPEESSAFLQSVRNLVI